MTRDRLLIGPAGNYHADELDGRYIVATPVDLVWQDTPDGGIEVLITATGEQVAFLADDPHVMPYEGTGTTAEVFTR